MLVCLEIVHPLNGSWMTHIVLRDSMGPAMSAGKEWRQSARNFHQAGDLGLGYFNQFRRRLICGPSVPGAPHENGKQVLIIRRTVREKGTIEQQALYFAIFHGRYKHPKAIRASLDGAFGIGQMNHGDGAIFRTILRKQVTV